MLGSTDPKRMVCFALASFTHTRAYPSPRTRGPRGTALLRKELPEAWRVIASDAFSAEAQVRKRTVSSQARQWQVLVAFRFQTPPQALAALDGNKSCRVRPTQAFS